MTDPFTGAGQPAPIPATVSSAPTGGAFAADGAGGNAMLGAGQRWRGYRLGEAWAGGSSWFHGFNSGSMEAVSLCVRPVTAQTEWRRQAWEKLGQLDSPQLARAVEAVEESGRRIEVMLVPTAPTLREWAKAHSVSATDLERIAQQLTQILSTLHDAGLAHLHVRPDTVYLEETSEGLEVVLGGLHDVLPYDQPDLIAVEVDPFYAPPEAAGLFRHAPGHGLCAWDWWALGRVLQEAMLGNHAYGLLFERDVSVPTPELRARAEQVLLERDPSGIRAGAVELMPEGQPELVHRLLRGLLASTADGRWQAGEVWRSLRGESVPDRYALARDARLFVWRRRAFLVPEAAEYFSSAEAWADGEANLFAPEGEPATLINFLSAHPAHRTELDKVRRILAQIDLPAWEHVSPLSRRTALAGLAWLALRTQGPSALVPLTIMGRVVDSAGLAQLVRDEAPSDAVEIIRALTARPYIQHVESLGAAAAVRALTQLAEHGGAAIQQAVENRWADPADFGLQAKVYGLALESEKELAGRREKLRAAYASNRDPRLAELLTMAQPERWALVLLAFMGQYADDYGFITHVEWNRQRHRALSEQAARVGAALLWQRLHAVMLGAPFWLGAWPIYGLIWLVPVLLACALRSWGWACLWLAVGAALRVAGVWLVRRTVRQLTAGAVEWCWRDSPARCRQEAARSLGETPVPTVRALRIRWRALATEAVALPLTPPPAPWVAPAPLTVFWAGTAGCVLLLSLLWLMQLGYIALPEAPAPVAVRPTLPDPRLMAPVLPPAEAAARARAAAQVQVRAVPAGAYEEVNDGFGKRLRGPLQRWDLPPPATAPPLPVRGQRDLNEDQAAFALISGAMLLEPYGRKSVDAVLAVRVPVEEDFGLVLFDGRQRALADWHVFLLAIEPQARTWYQLGTRKVVFLGEPKNLPATPPPQEP